MSTATQMDSGLITAHFKLPSLCPLVITFLFSTLP
jgi:hypothetical protein